MRCAIRSSRSSAIARRSSITSRTATSRSLSAALQPDHIAELGDHCPVGGRRRVGLAALIKASPAWGATTRSSSWAQRVERDARDELYVSLLGKSQTFHGRQRIGDIMARATNDVRFVNLLFAPALMLLVDSGMAIIVPLFVISRIDPRLLLVPLLFLVALAITVWDYNRRLNPVSQQLREQFGSMNAGLTESISGVEVVKANVRERYEWDKFTGNARDIATCSSARVTSRHSTCRPWRSRGMGGRFPLGRAAVAGRRDQRRQLISYIGLVGTLRFPTFMSMWIFNLVQMGVASSRRILERSTPKPSWMKMSPAMLRRSAARWCSRMSNSATATRRCSKGSASVRRRARPLPSSGRPAPASRPSPSDQPHLRREQRPVLIDGVDVRHWSLESLRLGKSRPSSKIRFLFSRTLAENIAFGCADASQETIEEAARAAQAHEFITSFREGYATEVGERGETLSGGQRQRIAIAAPSLPTRAS